KRDGAEQHDDWHRLMLTNVERMGLRDRSFLAHKGDVLIWSADLAHGGSPITDPELTRKSLVGHYCPERVEPIYFKLEPRKRARVGLDGGSYASQHYEARKSVG
ncbi:MAG: hypothetical protein QOG59_1265, partial [Solirubrobacteraceae bacterium]|nr:hypothetical protein [Solirubrobacteraceae bacterium]